MRPLPDIFRTFSCAAVVCAAAGWTSALAASAPDSLPRHAYAIDPEVVEWAQPLDVRQLMRDEVFLDALRSVLANPDYAEADKADAFYLLLKKIRWNFSGAIQIPPDMDYPATFDGMARTFLDYQAQLRDLRYDVAPFLRIAAADHRENVVRASHALLLAGLLDRTAAAGALEPLLAPEEIQRSQVPDVWRHHLALTTVLARKPALAARFAESWNSTASEEGREDVLLVLGIYRDADRIRALLAADQDPAHDLTLETGALVLRRCLPPDAFAEAFDGLLAANPVHAESLRSLKGGDFRSSTRTPDAFWKTWDGVDVVLYDDGIHLAYGEILGDFIPNDPPPPGDAGPRR